MYPSDINSSGIKQETESEVQAVAACRDGFFFDRSESCLPIQGPVLVQKNCRSKKSKIGNDVKDQFEKFETSLRCSRQNSFGKYHTIETAPK